MVDHHQHIHKLRPIVVYGLHDQVMNRPFPTSSSETFYQHLTTIQGPAEGTSLFLHIAVTQQTASDGKWMLVTTADNYQHARTYIDDLLPQEYVSLLTETNHSQWTSTFRNGPYRHRRSPQSSRDYALKIQEALSSSPSASSSESLQSPHRMPPTSNDNTSHHD